jgi:selenium metabolism protein YedF
MFFYTLTQDENIPSYILFMNDGVKATTNNDQVIEQLITLSEMGAVILVCGTCLNYYNITDKLKVGTVSNMYDIVNAMKAVDKVITL